MNFKVIIAEKKIRPLPERSTYCMIPLYKTLENKHNSTVMESR
jgi:hypothetical protein